MEEYVALDSTKQKRFVKSLKGIKKLIKKNDAETQPETIKEKPKHGKIKKKHREPRGLVYLSHIPHGFYEHEMTQYFKQFGVVTNARVIRSKQTGKSKGYAFVEFKEPAVGEIVAETMNNYLMGKRLIKAEYIPPEKQRRNALRKHWSPAHNPGKEMKIKFRKAFNEVKDDAEELKIARKVLSNLTRTKKKLSELGINYDFFTPVDIPDALINQVNIKKEKVEEESIKIESDEVKPKKNKKKDKASIEVEEVKVKEENENSKADKSDKTKLKTKKKAKSQKAQVIQKEKQKKLNEAGIKSIENFIKIKQDLDSNTSDSDYEFDSDEYEKIINDDNEYDSNSAINSDEAEDRIESCNINKLIKDHKGNEAMATAPKKIKNKAVKVEAANIIQPQKMKNKSSLKTIIKPKKRKLGKVINHGQLKKKVKKQ